MSHQAPSSLFQLSSTSLFSQHPPQMPPPTKRNFPCSHNTIPTDDPAVTRRSGNYQPSFWGYDFVQSLPSDYIEEKYIIQVERKKNEVKNLINGVMEPLAKLELIDAVQRLGLKYHFEVEIKKALDIIYNDAGTETWFCDDLYATSLHFRLLRQNGYDVSPDVFARFKEADTGNFTARICGDVEGLLSLYEASFLGFKEESIMDEAKAFATTHLKDIKGNTTLDMAKKVVHALEIPLHWTVPRLEARWFIDIYEQEPDMNPALLELAKLDYNIVQSFHRLEVRKLSRWWADMGLNKISFVRDRLVESYFWCAGALFEPQFGTFREMETKIICLITTIDDCYDVYGTIEELELFTDFVNRWDINGIDQLPHSLKVCLLAMFNTSNEIAYSTLIERGFNVIPYLKKMWADVCKAYLIEAKWYYEGYKPTFHEYLNNAIVSISATLTLCPSYFLTTDKIRKEALDYIYKFPSIIRCCAMLSRLANDLGTSWNELARGDTLKSIQCYMNETGASEEVASEYLTSLVHETWKTLNEDMHDQLLTEPLKNAARNLVRTAQCIYQYGDGYGIPDGRMKDVMKGLLMSLLVESVSLN